MSRNPRVRKVSPKTETAKPTKKFKANMTTLDAYSSTIALNQTFMIHVEQMYKSRDITNVKTAIGGMELLKANKMKEFTTKYANITKLVSKKTKKQKVRKDARDAVEQEEMDKVVRGVENIAYKPNIKISDKETEPPTYEVEFKRDYRNIMEAWEAAEMKLIRMTV